MDATPDQRRSFEAGESGELSPLMCVDKDPAALADFAALCDEAAAMGQPWVLVFAAALSGADWNSSSLSTEGRRKRGLKPWMSWRRSSII